MDSMKPRLSAWLPWAICALVVALTLLGMGLSLAGPAGTSTWANEALATGLAIAFALVAALILSRQPRNVIGWLLVSPALMIASERVTNSYLASFPAAPSVIPLPLFLLIWYANWSWLLLVIPIVLIPLFFPNGRPPGGRWAWVGAAAAIEVLVFVFLVTFSANLEPATDTVTWTVPNPVGFISSAQVEDLLGPWIACLGVITLLCLASLIVRYRRTGPVVRTQIRWLLYACGLFALVYVSGMFLPQGPGPVGQTVAGQIWEVGFLFSILAIPAAIAIGILRFRLWDIDVIIRRTLIYSTLTGILAMVYFGSVVILQGLFSAVGGQQSSAAIVASTLAIAALFAPLRRRVQGFIDRRFYRRKYDAAQTLADFAKTARDETNLEELTERLEGTVGQTVQPAHVSLWLKSRPGRQR